jgi:acetyl esterase
MISGDLETHDSLCRHLAAASGWQVLAVDYRLGPEHPYPAAVEDAMRVVTEIAPRAALGGDSAGASLALSGFTRETPALVLIYPMVDATRGCESHAEFRTGPGTSSEDIRYGYDQWLPPGADPRDPRVSPLFDPRLVEAPRSLVVTCGVDPLRDEGLLLRDRLPRCEHLHFEGEVHGFLTYPARFAAAGRTIAAMANFLNSDAA